MTEEAKSTKTRILDAAERLFAQRGPGGTSLRDITSAAGVNLAAVNYHFQSKEALMRAVVDRRIVPVQEERLARLAEATAVEGRPDLAKVIEALVLPPLEMLVTAPEFVPLFGRIYTEPEFVEEILKKHIFPMKTVLLEALMRACPHLSPDTIMWRVYFAIGSMTHILAGTHIIRIISNGKCDPHDIQQFRRQLVSFLVAGFQAPDPKDS
ncbi:MAG TPA: TetR/AcrR family transcriptional regulator [Bryobacteraceae bacterium]|nr:TetR/AcrR family transcriptional regulator [Bryobacteraceae bacterium]